MWKKLSPLLPVLLVTGCAATLAPTFTRLTAVEQPRNPKNQYLVETAFDSSQQSLRWDSINVSVLVNDQAYPMTPEGALTNRWEGYVPVPAGQTSVSYRFKFDYKYNHYFTAPKPATALSPVYTLNVLDN
jgi:hypothetical protein